MSFFNVIESLLNEQNLRTTKTQPIVSAIKNRFPISFYYAGPQRPRKTRVKNGYRVKAEAVALGLSKRGNLIVRAFVKPPSTSKTGFQKHGWRTFLINRMSNVRVFDNETFNEKRPGYEEGDDKSMTVTYVKTDWDVVSEPKPEVKPTQQTEPEKIEPTPEIKPEPKPEVKPEPTVEPTVEPESEPEEELPQPKPEEKPSENPEEDEEDKNLQENINRIKSLMLLLN